MSAMSCIRSSRALGVCSNFKTWMDSRMSEVCLADPGDEQSFMEETCMATLSKRPVKLSISTPVASIANFCISLRICTDLRTCSIPTNCSPLLLVPFLPFSSFASLSVPSVPASKSEVRKVISSSPVGCPGTLGSSGKYVSCRNNAFQESIFLDGR